MTYCKPMLDQQVTLFEHREKISEFVLFDSGSDDFYSMANEKIAKFRKAKDFKIIQNQRSKQEWQDCQSKKRL